MGRGYRRKASLPESWLRMILVCNDRDGALEVLDYMTENGISASERIPAMLRQKELSWTELENDPRRADTIERLERLIK